MRPRNRGTMMGFSTWLTATPWLVGQDVHFLYGEYIRVPPGLLIVAAALSVVDGCWLERRMNPSAN